MSLMPSGHGGVTPRRPCSPGRAASQARQVRRGPAGERSRSLGASASLPGQRLPPPGSPRPAAPLLPPPPPGDWPGNAEGPGLGGRGSRRLLPGEERGCGGGGSGG